MTDYYRTTIKVVVLSETPYDPENLAGVHYDITEGECSGQWGIESYDELTPKEMAKALMKQGSDPGYFQLDEDGNKQED